MRYRFFGQRVSEKPIELKIIPLVRDSNCLYGPGDLIELIAENAAETEWLQRLGLFLIRSEKTEGGELHVFRYTLPPSWYEDHGWLT